MQIFVFSLFFCFCSVLFLQWHILFMLLFLW
jgi:hypothetical protein